MKKYTDSMFQLPCFNECFNSPALSWPKGHRTWAVHLSAFLFAALFAPFSLQQPTDQPVNCHKRLQFIYCNSVNRSQWQYTHCCSCTFMADSTAIHNLKHWLNKLTALPKFTQAIYLPRTVIHSY